MLIQHPHAGSRQHFATLTSDRTLRLYHVDQPEAPEQQLHLQLQPQRQGPRACWRMLCPGQYMPPTAVDTAVWQTQGDGVQG